MAETLCTHYESPRGLPTELIDEIPEFPMMDLEGSLIGRPFSRTAWGGFAFCPSVEGDAHGDFRLLSWV